MTAAALLNAAYEQRAPELRESQHVRGPREGRRAGEKLSRDFSKEGRGSSLALPDEGNSRPFVPVVSAFESY